MSDYDFKQEWPKIKKQLGKLSQEAIQIAKKGEDQLLKLSHKGKMHVDSAALALKKEHLYHLVGKAYVQNQCGCPKSTKMQKLIAEVQQIERDIKSIRKRIKSRAAKPS